MYESSPNFNRAGGITSQSRRAVEDFRTSLVEFQLEKAGGLLGKLSQASHNREVTSIKRRQALQELESIGAARIEAQRAYLGNETAKYMESLFTDLLSHLGVEQGKRAKDAMSAIAAICDETDAQLKWANDQPWSDEQKSRFEKACFELQNRKFDEIMKNRILNG